MKQSLEILKSYFETGDKPTQAQYEDMFDSLSHNDQNPIPIHTVEASTTYASAAYNPIYPFRSIPSTKSAFTNNVWLCELGTTTNQRLCIYFSNPCSISKFTYINSGSNNIQKGGIKTCRMYGMTSRMAYSTNHGTIVPEMTNTLYSGDLEVYSQDQFIQGGTSVTIPKSPLIYGIILDIDNRYGGEAYLGLRSMNFYQ